MALLDIILSAILLIVIIITAAFYIIGDAIKSLFRRGRKRKPK